MNRYATILAINVVVGAVPAYASDVLPSSWQAAAVGDDVLATATGKYANQNMITGFQLVMTSQLQTSAGGSLYANGVLNVAQNANGNYTATTSASTGIVAGATGVVSSGLQAVTGASNVLVNGVAQITQVAGNGNSALNNAVIQFTPAVQTGSAGQGASSSQTILGAMSASVAITAAGVQLQLTTPNGIVSQSIAGGAGSPMNQVMQVVQVAGNGQQALNSLQLNLQTGAITANALRQIGIQNALANMVVVRH